MLRRLHTEQWYVITSDVTWTPGQSPSQTRALLRLEIKDNESVVSLVGGREGGREGREGERQVMSIPVNSQSWCANKLCPFQYNYAHGVHCSSIGGS